MREKLERDQLVVQENAIPPPEVVDPTAPAGKPPAKKAPAGGEGGAKKEPGSNSAGTAKEDHSMNALALEVSACNKNAQEAYKCCTQPESCGASSGQSSYMPPPSNDPEGMERYCEQMKNSASQGRSANADAAGVCASGHNGCSISCENSKKKWEAYKPSCVAPNCDPALVAQAIATFTSKTSQCKGYQENESLLAQQSSSNYSDAQQAEQCEKESGMDPSSAGEALQEAMKQEDKQDCSGENATKPECVDCSKYPNSPLCMGQNNQANTAAVNDFGQSALDEATQPTIGESGFNVGADGIGQQGLPSFDPIQPQASSANVIPNGGGGMSGGGAAGGGGMGGSGDGGGSGESGYNTDVLQGERGGGGASGGGMQTASAGGGFSGYASGGTGEGDSKYGALDLKAYLPGGANDPNRKVASVEANKTKYPDVNSSMVSMFNRISLHFSMRCKLKQFDGCK